MKHLLILMCGLCLSFTLQAAEIGDVLPTFSLEDAHGQEHQLNDQIMRIYANGDRSGDKLIKAAMEQRDQSVLDAQHAIVIGEISAAPGFVRRIIKGSLNDRSYTTWVDERGKTKKWLPYRADKIAVIDLRLREIVAIRYIADREALQAVLDEPEQTLSPTANPAPSTPAPDASSN